MKKTQQIITTIISLILLTLFAGSVQAQVWYGNYTISVSSDIEALSGYTEITGNLHIESDTLTSLSGLDTITSVGGELDIWYNDILTSLSGLENLNSVGGHLYIIGNTNLTSLNALSNITSIGNGLLIQSNYALTSLSALEKITFLKDLFIGYNTALTSLRGLENITVISDYLSIQGNDVLTNLCALYTAHLQNNLLLRNNTLLSMDTAYALEAALINNGFTGESEIHDNNGSGLVVCDIDDDTVDDDIDNCPSVPNPGQEDIDGDTIGDVCDKDTVYGKVTGEIQDGVTITITKASCGAVSTVAVITDENGNYAYGGLESGTYSVVASLDGYSFNRSHVIDILQTQPKFYNFISTLIRFVDNGDGTVLDVLTDITWLKDANCYSWLDWEDAISSVALLGNGECDLSDGSTPGYWRLASKDELQSIGTDPPTTWYSTFPSATWTKPSAPFINVQSNDYWSGTNYGSNTEAAWFVGIHDGFTSISNKFNFYLVWPVRFSRFTDNGDGTFTDTLTDLVWLKNANCYSRQDWYQSGETALRLNSGECGLSDGSVEGDWRLPTVDELHGIGVEPPFTWEEGEPTVGWTQPTPFDNLVLQSFYWTSNTWVGSTGNSGAYGVGMDDGVRTKADFTNGNGEVWPVRSW